MELNFQDDFDKNAGSCISNCREKIKSEETREGLIEEFFSNSENLSKLIAFLKNQEISQEDIFNIFYFFTELLKCIATGSPENLSSGSKLVKQIFKNNLKVFMKMAKSDPESVSLGLKFLTRAAMISEGTASEVLSSFQWNEYNLNLVMEHDEPRKWMFRLILVFLNKDGCMKQFCGVGILQRSFPYLIKEKDASIEKVLSTVYEKILMNSDVPNKMKAKIFSTNSLKFLFPIYKLASSEEPKKKSTVETLHSLMLTIYSDVKCGILSQEKSSIYYLTLLTSEKSLLDIALGKELIAGAISQWPNLVSHIISQMQEDQETIHAGTLVALLSVLNIVLGNDTQWIISHTNLKTAEWEVLKKTLTEMFDHDSSLVKYHCLKLINLIYSRLCKGSATELENYMHLKDICPADVLVKLWHLLSTDSTKSEVKKDGIKVIKLLKLIINILHSYFVVNPDVKILNSLKISNMLKDLNDYSFKRATSVHYIRTFYYLVSLISMAKCRENFAILDMNNKTMNDMHSGSPFSLMCSLYVEWQDSPDDVLVSVDTSAAEKIFFNVVTSDLNCFGIRVSESELKIWLTEVSKGDKKSRSCFFTKVVMEAIRLSQIYSRTLYTLQKSQEQSCEEENLMSNLYEEDSSECLDNEDVCVIPITEPFSCLVLSAIDILKENANEDWVQYFSTVMQHYIHSLSSPEMLSRQLLSVGELLTDDVRSFLDGFLVEHNSSQGLQSAKLPFRLDAIFKAHSCPNVTTFMDSFPNLLQEEVDNESICTQILYYIRTEKYKSNKNKRPKHYKFFCKLLIELLKVWHVNEIVSPFKFLLSNSFLLESYSPFLEVDGLNEVIICLLIFSSRTSGLLNLMKKYCDKTVDTFKRFAYIGDTDVLSPFEIFLTPYFFSYAMLEEVINCCSKFSVVENEFICELLTKLVESFNDLTNDTNLPDEKSVIGLSSLMLSLDKQMDQAKSRILSEMIQKSIVKFLICFKGRNLSQALKENILACENLSSHLQCQVLSMDNLSSKEIAERFLSMKNFILETEAPFIAALACKSKTELTTKSFAKCRESVIDWVKIRDSNPSPHCAQILKYFLTKSIIGMPEAKEIADQWYDTIVNQNEPPPPHILDMYVIFDKLGEKYRHMFLLICMQSVQKCYLPRSQFSTEYTTLIANAPQKIISLGKSINNEEQEMKAVFKSFWKQVLKVSLTDQQYGHSYLDCLIKLLPHIDKKGYNLKRMFKILCSHSQFTEVMNGSHGIHIKEEVIKLMVVLLEESPDLCDEKHIPLLLAAYDASLSTCDQYLLKLLQVYDKASCLCKFPPVIYGTAAKKFFASKAGAKADFGSLKWSKYQQLLLLIKPEKVVRTAMNFDSSMDLVVSQIVSKSECNDIYDQRYLVMLAAFLTSGNGISNFAIINSNLLIIAIAALTSQVDTVWATGALVLNNLCRYFKVKNKAKKLLKLEWLISILRNTMHGKKVRLPNVFAQLLIEIISCIDSPRNPIAQELINYIYKKDSMNINSLKQLKTWLNPSKPDCNVVNALQETVVRVIGRSVNCAADWKFLQNDGIFNHLLSLGLCNGTRFKLRSEICIALFKAYTNSKTARKYLIENRNLSVFLSVMRKDVEESQELENKSQTLMQIDAFLDSLDKLNTLSLSNIPVIKFDVILQSNASKKRKLPEDCVMPPEKILRMSPSTCKNEISTIKEETDDYYLSEDLEESMCVDEIC